jgi:hypothetical protein
MLAVRYRTDDPRSEREAWRALCRVLETIAHHLGR